MHVVVGRAEWWGFWHWQFVGMDGRGTSLAMQTHPMELETHDSRLDIYVCMQMPCLMHVCV
jgi:hypothetical protein